jgi:uncharacterized protein (DUF2062 family)/trans-aconitate methyltransferase
MTSHLRRTVWELRTEGSGPAREASAIALGLFIGCSPLYGFHLLLCWAAGWCLGLNRLKMYLAANISNPFVAPLLILIELQAGAWVRRGQPHRLTLETVRNVDPWSFGADIIVGSVIVGGILALVTGGATYLLARGGRDDPWFAELVRRASDRYVSSSITAWEFARGKLRGDPLYRTVFDKCRPRSHGTLVDVGCGQGLMLGLLAESAAAWRTGEWPAAVAAPPVFEALVGIELRPRIAALARAALARDAAIIEGDARDRLPPRSSAIFFFDVLHMMPGDTQLQLLETAAATLEEGGTLLVREPDAGAGWGFRAVHAGNAIKAAVTGNWRQTFHFRTAAEWSTIFERLGFAVECSATGEGTPFANVLFVLTARSRGSE